MGVESGRFPLTTPFADSGRATQIEQLIGPGADTRLLQIMVPSRSV